MSMGLITMTGAFKPQETLLIYENCRAIFQYLLSLVRGKIVSTLELRLFGTAYSFFPTTNKSGWPMAIGHLISTAMCYINSTGFPFMFPLCKLSLVFVLPDKATGSTLCVARGQLCRGSSVGIQATEEMATTIGRRVHVTCE